MKKFSWHSKPGLAPHWYKIYGWLPNRYLPIVMFGDSIPIYKPNMKGGHRHNHVYNKCHKYVFRGKNARKIDRNDKKEFVRIFYIGLKLNRNFGEFLHKIFYKNNNSTAQ